jgi:hypothetical protein
MADRVDLLVQLPPELKQRLAADANAGLLPLNDLINRIVARRIGWRYEDEGGPKRPVGDSPRVIVRMPEAMKHALALYAISQRTNMTGVVVHALSDEYGLDYTPSSRAGRTPTGRSA